MRLQHTSLSSLEKALSQAVRTDEDSSSLAEQAKKKHLQKRPK